MPSPRRVAVDLLPGDVIVVEGPVSDHTQALYPEELGAVHRAVETRRQEFSTGRALARTALQRLGVATGPIPRGSHGAPQWPSGVTGSIAHTHDHCAVAVAPIGTYASLGLDIEVEADVREDFSAHICSEGERRRYGRGGLVERGTLARLFSAKECFYKCQFPLTRRFLDFHDVEVELELDDEARFWVKPRLRLELPPSEDRDRGYPGRSSARAGVIASGMVITRSLIIGGAT